MSSFYCLITYWLGTISHLINPINPKNKTYSNFRKFLVEKIYNRLFYGFSSTSHCSPSVLNYAVKFAGNKGTLFRGDYFEFGVYKGYSIWKMQQLLKKHPKVRLFGFDSFAGLPKPIGFDANGEFYAGQYACSLEVVSKNITSHGGNIDSIILIKGFFEKTLNLQLKKKYKMKHASIVLIDCDLYYSTVKALDFIKNLLMPGTLILFDDWNGFRKDNNRGERKAYREFLEKNPKIKSKKAFTFCWHGEAFEISAV